MEKKIISNLFQDGGAIVTQKINSKIQDLSYSKVVSLFEKTGLILFKKFNIKPEKLTDITDRFTETYAVDAIRRKVRFN